jgi:hypothetical protein
MIFYYYLYILGTSDTNMDINTANVSQRANNGKKISFKTYTLSFTICYE